MIKSKVKHISKASVLPYLAAFCLLNVVPPSYAWHNILPGVAAVLFLVLIITNIVQNGLSKGIGLNVLFLFVYFLYAYQSSLNFNGFLFILCIPLAVFAKDAFHIKTYDAFKQILAILLLLSIVVYILVAFLKVPIPGNPIEALNSNKPEAYVHYPLLVITLKFGVIVPRFYFIFDEPGVVGTICAIILAIEKFNFKNRQNYVFLIAGVLSLSFFFLLTCAVYVIINAKTKYKITVSLLIIALYYLFSNNEILDELVIQRFMFADGSFAGDNRSTIDFNNFYEGFRNSPDYLWGLGVGKGHAFNEGGSSYKQYIVDFGLVFFIVYMVVYLSLCRFFKMRKKDAILMLFVVIGVMYQRPFFGQLHLAYLLYAGCIITGIVSSSKDILKSQPKKL